MGNRANPTVGPCRMKLSDPCNSCADAAPRYLCFHADIRAHSSGTGSGTGTTDVPCCTEIDVRMTPGLPGGGGCGWFRDNIACSDGSANLGSITVEILKDRGTGTGTGSGTGTGPATRCVTRVTGSAWDYPIDFPGVLPSGEMTFTVIHNHIAYDCEIRTASMVGNPSAYETPCPPCACTTALPSALCTRVVMNDGRSASGVATWDCETKSWNGSTVYPQTGTGTGTGTTGGFAVSLRMATAADNVGCAIIGNVSGDGADNDFLISLESGSEADGDRGITCTEENGVVRRGSAPYADFDVFNVVNATVSIVKVVGTGTGTSEEVIGTLYVTDHACGGECHDGCSATPAPCCSDTILPDTLTASVSGCYSVAAFTLTRPLGQDYWQGTDALGTLWTLTCTGESVWNMHILEVPALCPAGGTNVTATSSSCEPFEALFTVGTSGGACDPMNPCIHNTDIAVTA